jgi:hypothetical protein
MPLPGKHKGVRAVRISPDGRLVIFGSGGTLRIWDVTKGAYVTPGEKK